MESLIFNRMESYDYENLFFCQEKTLGLRAIIAIHNTTLALPPVAYACGLTRARRMPLPMCYGWRAA